MKTTKILTPVILVTVAMHMTTYAQGEDNKGNAGPFGKRLGGPPKILLEKFDKDGDGNLSEAERTELKKAMIQRREAREAKMLKRFDSDKNGTLSREEKRAAFPTIVRENKEIRQAAIKQFDQDGDGILSSDERNGAREWVEQNYPDAILMRPGYGARAGKGGPRCKKGPKAGRKAPRGNGDKPGEEEDQPAAQ